MIENNIGRMMRRCTAISKKDPIDRRIFFTRMQKCGEPYGPFPKIDNNETNLFHINIYVAAAQLDRLRRNGSRFILASLGFALDARAKVIIEDFLRWFPRALLLSHLPPSRPEFFRWNVQSFIAVEVELPQLRKLTGTLWKLGQLVSM